MVTENKTGRFIAEKLAIPVILVISLLAARLVVEMKSAIRLSEPVELSRSGLSVSMPQGNGWKCDEKWMYDNTSLTISSVFSVDGTRNEAYASCRYELVSAANEGTLEQRIKNEAAGRSSAQLGAVQTGRLAAGPLIVDWAGITADLGNQGRFEIIFGDCQLSAGRRLEIEVFQRTEEPGIAQRVLEKIVKKIRFSDNGLLRAGADVVSEVRAVGLVPDDLSDSKTILFVISDATEQAIGFTMDVMAAAKTDANFAVKAASYFYVRGRIPDERVGSFLSDNAFKRFNWKIESNTGAGSRGIEMTVQDGILTVGHLRGGASASLRAGRKNIEYLLSEAAVPDIDIVLEQILKNVLDGSRQEIIIDVIKADGTIVPVSIKKAAADANSVKAELLDGQGNWQQIYYTSSKERSKIIYGQENSYTLTRADPNQIIALFPERAHFIRDQKQLLERESP
jgi:hypothetical protein